jgi:hypothetical protein
MRYEVQFRSSGIVAFSSHDRGLCQHFIECNNYAPEVPEVDPETGEITSDSDGHWLKGECLNLFTLKRVSA